MSKHTRNPGDDFEIDFSRYFDPATHLWVETRDSGSVRCGFDPLGAETSGDIVAVSFEPVGSSVARGGAFGSLEAAKFVGPLEAPVAGTISGHNGEVFANPGLLNVDSQTHWLIELEPADLERDLALLLHGEHAVRVWLAAERRKLEAEGLLAT